MNEFIIRGLGYLYSLIALPALAIIGIVYFRKYRSKGSIFFAIGAIATALGSMFNQLFPLKIFFNESTGTLSSIGSLLTSIALICHILGFFILVIGLGIITFAESGENV